MTMNILRFLSIAAMLNFVAIGCSSEEIVDATQQLGGPGKSPAEMGAGENPGDPGTIDTSVAVESPSEGDDESERYGARDLAQDQVDRDLAIIVVRKHQRRDKDDRNQENNGNSSDHSRTYHRRLRPSPECIAERRGL